jgi:hypothetical protein
MEELLPATDEIKKATKSLKLHDLQVFYLYVTAIFILTGFVYNFLFFRFFGIRVENFFTLQDYLASSIEKIYLIIISILFATISSHVARYIIREQNKFLSHRIIAALLYCIPAVMTAGGILMLVRYKEPSGYFLLSFAIFIAGDFFLFRIVFRGDHGSYSRYFYFTVLIFYLLLIFSAVIYERDYVLSEPMRSLTRYKVQFTRNIKINERDCIVLEANSSYFFFYDKKQNRAYVVPKDGISYIETSNLPDTGSDTLN